MTTKIAAVHSPGALYYTFCAVFFAKCKKFPFARKVIEKDRQPGLKPVFGIK